MCECVWMYVGVYVCTSVRTVVRLILNISVLCSIARTLILYLISVIESKLEENERRNGVWIKQSYRFSVVHSPDLFLHLLRHPPFFRERLYVRSYRLLLYVGTLRK